MKIINSKSDTRIENLKKLYIVSEIEFIFKNLPTKKTLALDGFTGEFYQTLGKKIICITQFLQEIEEGTLFIWFYKTNTKSRQLHYKK